MYSLPYLFSCMVTFLQEQLSQNGCRNEIWVPQHQLLCLPATCAPASILLLKFLFIKHKFLQFSLQFWSRGRGSWKTRWHQQHLSKHTQCVFQKLKPTSQYNISRHKTMESISSTLKVWLWQKFARWWNITYAANNSAAQLQEKDFVHYYIKRANKQLSASGDPARRAPRKAPSGGSNI